MGEQKVLGVDEFLNKTIERFPEMGRCKDFIERFIESSEAKRIEIVNFSFGYDYALGLSLHNVVLFNTKAFDLNLPIFLYTLFHEFAHQYQFKKYGGEKMYELYGEEMNIKEAANTMRNIELVADEFAMRKIRELIKLGYLNKENEIKNSPYKNVTMKQFEGLVNGLRKKIRNKGVNTTDEISDTIYSMVRANGIKNTFDKIRTILN